MPLFPRKDKRSTCEDYDPQKACSRSDISSLLGDVPGFKQDMPSWGETHKSLALGFDEMNEDISVSSPNEGDLTWSSEDLCECYMNGISSPHSTDKLHGVPTDMIRREALDLWERIVFQSDDVRVRAIDALGMLKDRMNALVFVQALRDNYWEVRAAAAQALGELGEQAFALPLLKALQGESDFTARQSLVRALGQCRQERSIKVLVQLLRDQDQNWLVREAAAWALGKFGRTVPIWFLLEALCSDPDEMVRAAVARALGEIEHPSAQPLLVEVARGDEDEDVREAAGWALQKLEKREKWQLLRVLRDVPRNWLERPSSESRVGDDWQTVHKRVLFALTRFIRNKTGFVSYVELVHYDQQPTLFLSYCYQQTGQMLQDEVISQIETTIPIEPIGSVVADRRGLLQEVQRRAAEIQAKRRWYETTIVILELHPSGTGPTRAVLCGIGCHAVRSSDPLILDQLLRQWRSYCQGPRELRSLQIGYQSCDALSS